MEEPWFETCSFAGGRLVAEDCSSSIPIAIRLPGGLFVVEASVTVGGGS